MNLADPLVETPVVTPAGLSSIAAITAALASVGYIATRQIATAVYLAHHLQAGVDRRPGRRRRN